MEAIHFFYLKCFGLSFLGVVLNTVMKMNGARSKALSNNLIWSYKDHFFLEIWSIVGNLIAIVMTMFFVKDIQYEIGKEWVTLMVLALSGFIGSEFIIRIFGVSNKYINNAIKYKTQIADKSNNTEENPTPIK